MKYNFPKATIPEGFSDASAYLLYLVKEGAMARYGIISNEVKERIAYELSCLEGFEHFYILLYHIVEFCKKEHYMLGNAPGHNSCSVINYCLGITDVDPIRWHLHFERFFLKGMTLYPDICLTVEEAGRDAIIQYLKEAYGSQNVIDSLDYFRSHKPLMGFHLFGVYVLDRPYNEILHEEADSDESNGSIDLQTLSKTMADQGFIPIDITGYQTLGETNRLLRYIETKYPGKVDFNDLPLDDEETFRFLSSGQRMNLSLWNNKRETFAAVRPRNITELCNAYALCMPPTFFYDRLTAYLNHKKEAELISPICDNILRETRGQLLYQKQVTEIIQVITGLSYADCELIRRQMKRQPDLAYKTFEEGAKKHGIVNFDEIEASWIFLLFRVSNTYMRSHALSMALTIYKTTWLYIHYQEEAKLCNPNWFNE